MSQQAPALASGLRRSRAALGGVFVYSALVNLLYLTSSFFMLEVYDRVIPSRSLATLFGLGVLALLLYVMQGALDALRARLLVRASAALDAAVSDRIVRIVMGRPLTEHVGGDGLLPLRDLDQVRGFLAGTGPQALFDLPWMPIYLVICYLFHPWIGAAALGGALILVVLTVATDALTRGPSAEVVELGQQRNMLAEAGRRNAEALKAMGMANRLTERWNAINGRYIDAQGRAADVSGGFGAMSKIVRIALQSVVLGIGAALVIDGRATAGIIIASSILTARALAPAEAAIANWKGLVAARQSWRRLHLLLQTNPAKITPLALAPPTRTLSVANLSVTPPGAPRAVLVGATFTLQAGQAIGIIGPSASGKSTLVRALVGAWTPSRGDIRLDGATIDQWSDADLGRHLGYLPQEVELFAGTVADNIARLEPDAAPAKVVAAAHAACVHELIVNLPQGYDTMIGEGGAGLSAGQRQRIGLARALYGDPFVVVLDEPNANLDAEGEGALTEAIAKVRERGGICVVVSHRASALAMVDLVTVVSEGRILSIGARDEVLKRVLRPAAAPAELPVAAVRERGGAPSLREIA